MSVTHPNDSMQNISNLSSFHQKVLFGASSESFENIIRVDLNTTEVSKLTICSDKIEEESLNENWDEFHKKLIDTVHNEDKIRVLRLTELSALQSYKDGDIYRLNFRSTYLSPDGTVRWYFVFFRVFNTDIIFYFINETPEVNKRILLQTTQTQRADQYKRAIVADAIVIYEFNLSKDKIIGSPVQRISGRNVPLFETLGLNENSSFKDFTEAFTWDLSEPERQKFLSRVDPVFLRDCYIRGEYETWFDYSRKSFDGEIFWSRNTIILTKDEVSGDIFGLAVVKNITNTYFHEQEKVYQMEIINGLTTEYSNVYMVNLLTSRIRVVRLNDRAGAFYNEAFGEQLYEDSLDFYISVSVFEGDRDMMRMAFSKDNIMAQLARRDTFYANYRSFINNKIEYMKLKVVRIGDANEYTNVLLGFMNVDDEIQHEMQQKKKLEEALALAENASQSKTRFLSSMSHDIRTPMNAIIGYTNLAQDHTHEPEQIQDYLSKIKSSGTHLLSLINDILDLSRIESGKLSIENAPCTVETVVREVSDVMQSQIQMKHQNFYVESKGDITKTVIFDSLRMKQILINVIGNAVKYTNDNGTIRFIITEIPSSDPGYTSYQFKIKDNGIGMSRKYQEHLFEPFERDLNEKTKTIQGSGLGLAITKNLIDLMNGAVYVKSEEGRGTEFMICFDFEDSKEEINAESLKLGESVNLSKFRGARILLVEDNELNRDIAREIIRPFGFYVEEAINGKKALEMIEHSEPGYYSLVLMDVLMPIMNGYEATKKIRNLSNKKLAKIPIVAMTANAFEEDRRQALENGMDAYISKPFEIRSLMQVLYDMLDKNS